MQLSSPSQLRQFQPAPAPDMPGSTVGLRIAGALAELTRLDDKLAREHRANYFVSGEWTTELHAVAGKLGGAARESRSLGSSQGAYAAELLAGAADRSLELRDELARMRADRTPFSPANAALPTFLDVPLGDVRMAQALLRA